MCSTYMEKWKAKSTEDFKANSVVISVSFSWTNSYEFYALFNDHNSLLKTLPLHCNYWSK